MIRCRKRQHLPKHPSETPSGAMVHLAFTKHFAEGTIGHQPYQPIVVGKMLKLGS